MIDRFETRSQREYQAGPDGVISLQNVAQHQSVLIARTGVEAGLSAPISFGSLQIESLPLERPDVDGEPNIDIIRTSLATAVRFIIGLEQREKFASPENGKIFALDRSLNPDSLECLSTASNIRHNPEAWADAHIIAAEKHGYDHCLETWASIRRVQANLIGEVFSELRPTPFGRRWKE